jgi:hypothetical protein
MAGAASTSLLSMIAFNFRQARRLRAASRKEEPEPVAAANLASHFKRS